MRCAFTVFGSIRRSPRRLASWLAILALVVNALAPTLAQAVVSGSGNGDWVQVCSVTGVTWIKADNGTGAPLGVPGQAGGHPMDQASSASCPWCSLHGGTPGMPADVQGHLQTQASGESPLPAFTSAAKASVLHLGAPARAPPIVS